MKMVDSLQLQLNELNDNFKNSRTTYHQSICVCCLSQNANFVNLATCKHTGFFEYFYIYKIEYQTSSVCLQCHHFLKQIEAFKAQVDKSLEILNRQVKLLEKPKCFRNLQSSNTEVTTITDGLLDECKTEPTVQATTSRQDHYISFETDIKIEHESFPDFDNDIPLSKIKKEEKKKKKKSKAKAASVLKASAQDGKRRSNLKDKYEGKIVLVNQNREELMLEREKEAKKETYLKLPFRCEDCIVGFDHEINLKNHIESRHTERKGGFECDICRSVLKNQTTFKEHVKRHFQRYECVECGKRNNNLYSVMQHYNVQHGTIDAQFTCTDCGFISNSHRAYRYHRDKHKKKQQCSICDSTFVNNTGLRVHMLTVHNQSTRVYSCDKCDKSYKAKSGLSAHISASHTGAGAYCAPCGRHFRTEHNLAHHRRTHSSHVTDDAKLICDECGSKFVTKTALKQHIDFVHLKSKKFECQTCKKVFKNGSALKKHDDFVHKKLRPPRNKICDICGRGFTSLAVLRCHIWSHTGERPFPCAHCPATFAHPAARYTHTKLLHAARK